MHAVLSTPKKRISLLIFGVILIMLQPVFTVAHYVWNDHRGAYDLQADNIIIPIIAELVTWAVLAPFAIYIVVRILRRYESNIPLFARNSFVKKSLKTNIIFAFLLAFTLIQLIDVFQFLNIPMLLDEVLSVYLLLSLRVLSLLNRSNKSSKPVH